MKRVVSVAFVPVAASLPRGDTSATETEMPEAKIFELSTART
jgi:hypothetical protein